MGKEITQKSTPKDQHTIVLEDINSKFSFVLEQFSGLRQEMKENHQEFVEFKGEMLDFKKEFVEFRKDADANFKVTLEYLQRIDDEIQSLKSELADLKPQLKDKTALDKVLDMEKRLLKIEKLVFAKLS